MDLNIPELMHMQGITDFTKVDETIAKTDSNALLYYLYIQPKPSDSLYASQLRKRAVYWSKIINSLESEEMLEVRYHKRKQLDFDRYEPNVVSSQPDLVRLDSIIQQRRGFDYHYIYPTYITFRIDPWYREPGTHSLFKEILKNKLATKAGMVEKQRVDLLLRRARLLKADLSRFHETSKLNRRKLIGLYESYYSLGHASTGREVSNSRFNYDILGSFRPDVGPAGVVCGNRHAIIAGLTELPIGKNLPQEAENDFWTSCIQVWLDLMFELDLIIRFRKRPTQLALDKLKHATWEARGARSEALGSAQLSEMKGRGEGKVSKEDALLLGQDYEIMFSLDLVTTGTDLADLDVRADEINRSFVKFGGKGEIFSGYAALLKWLKLAPGGDLHDALPIRGTQTVILNNFVSSDPFVGHKPRLQIIIKNGMGSIASQFDPWHPEYPNTLIELLGPTGAGKTIVAEKLGKVAVEQAAKCSFVDWADSFKKLAQMTKNSVYMEATEDDFLDAFDIYNPLRSASNYEFSVQSILTFLLSMLGHNPDSNQSDNKSRKIIINEAQEVLIFKSLKEFIGKANKNNFFLQEFYEFFQKGDNDALKEIFYGEENGNFRDYCTQVLYKYLNFPFLGKHFDPANQRHRLPLARLFESDFAVWGLKAIKNQDNLKPFYIDPLVNNFYLDLFSKRKTAAFLDEVHFSVNEKRLCNLLDNIRIARQNHMLMMYALQYALNDGSNLASVFDMAHIKIVAGDKLQPCLTKRQEEHHQQCDPTKHDYLLIVGKESYIINLEIDDYEWPIYETHAGNCKNIVEVWNENKNPFDSLDELEKKPWKVN